MLWSWWTQQTKDDLNIYTDRHKRHLQRIKLRIFKNYHILWCMWCTLHKMHPDFQGYHQLRKHFPQCSCLHQVWIIFFSWWWPTSSFSCPVTVFYCKVCDISQKFYVVTISSLLWYGVLLGIFQCSWPWSRTLSDSMGSKTEQRGFMRGVPWRHKLVYTYHWDIIH